MMWELRKYCIIESVIVGLFFSMCSRRVMVKKCMWCYGLDVNCFYCKVLSRNEIGFKIILIIFINNIDKLI